MNEMHTHLSERSDGLFDGVCVCALYRPNWRNTSRTPALQNLYTSCLDLWKWWGTEHTHTKCFPSYRNENIPNTSVGFII